MTRGARQAAARKAMPFWPSPARWTDRRDRKAMVTPPSMGTWPVPHIAPQRRRPRRCLGGAICLRLRHSRTRAGRAPAIKPVASGDGMQCRRASAGDIGCLNPSGKEVGADGSAGCPRPVSGLTGGGRSGAASGRREQGLRADASGDRRLERRKYAGKRRPDARRQAFCQRTDGAKMTTRH